MTSIHAVLFFEQDEKKSKEKKTTARKESDVKPSRSVNVSSYSVLFRMSNGYDPCTV